MARGDPVMTGGRALERGTSWTPRFIQPMRPTPAAPFHRPGWIYEEKYDGWRVMAYKQGATVKNPGVRSVSIFGEAVFLQ